MKKTTFVLVAASTALTLGFVRPAPAPQVQENPITVEMALIYHSPDGLTTWLRRAVVTIALDDTPLHCEGPGCPAPPLGTVWVTAQVHRTSNSLSDGCSFDAPHFQEDGLISTLVNGCYFNGPMR